MSKKKTSNSNPSVSVISANTTEKRTQVLIDESLNKSLFTKLRKQWWLVAVIGVLSLGVLGSTLKYLDDD
ncbi:MAG: hypothetical protein LUM44_00005, partial [Pyrinomonadaceae bacterium]|nr:hypothetical protein [Pyrinomonadaceae bacterium]